MAKENVLEDGADEGAVGLEVGNDGAGLEPNPLNPPNVEGGAGIPNGLAGGTADTEDEEEDMLSDFSSKFCFSVVRRFL